MRKVSWVVHRPMSDTNDGSNVDGWLQQDSRSPAAAAQALTSMRPNGLMVARSACGGAKPSGPQLGSEGRRRHSSRCASARRQIRNATLFTDFEPSRGGGLREAPHGGAPPELQAPARRLARCREAPCRRRPSDGRPPTCVRRLLGSSPACRLRSPKRPASQVVVMLASVPGAGFEPARGRPRGILSPLRMPVSPPGPRAGNGTRTRDPNLGKVVLYQLSYSRRRRGS